jgi:hypothetical protein
MQYLFFGLKGHSNLVPYIWTAMIFNIAAFFLFLVPQTRENYVTLNIGCVLIFCGAHNGAAQSMEFEVRHGHMLKDCRGTLKISPDGKKVIMWSDDPLLNWLSEPALPLGVNVVVLDKEQKKILETKDSTKTFSGGFEPNISSYNLLARDFAKGQMARDMTLFVDDDGKAYHIYASEENSTMHISILTDDYSIQNVANNLNINKIPAAGGPRGNLQSIATSGNALTTPDIFHTAVYGYYMNGSKIGSISFTNKGEKYEKEIYKI